MPLQFVTGWFLRLTLSSCITSEIHGLVCVSLCVCMSVRLLLRSGRHQWLHCDTVQTFIRMEIVINLHSKVVASYAYCDIKQQYCSEIQCNFLTTESSKALKKAKNWLSTTWNMNQCKAVSFVLFSLSRNTNVLPIVNSTCAFLKA